MPLFNQEKLSILDYIHVYLKDILHKSLSKIRYFFSPVFFLISVGVTQSFSKRQNVLIVKEIYSNLAQKYVFIVRHPEIGIGKL